MAKVTVPQAKVTVLRPGTGTALIQVQSLRVSGRAVGRGGPEPTHVEEMTVSLDGGSPVQAHVTIVPKQPVPTVLFDAQIQAPTSLGPHTITVVAIYDDEPRKTASVTVHVLAPASPRESLQISVVNPPTPAGANWAADIVNQNLSIGPNFFSLLSLVVFSKRGSDYPACKREWNQVVAPAEDYDSDPVGFTGWLLQPEISGGDVPFVTRHAEWARMGRETSGSAGMTGGACGVVVAGDRVGTTEWERPARLKFAA